MGAAEQSLLSNHNSSQIIRVKSWQHSIDGLGWWCITISHTDEHDYTGRKSASKADHVDAHANASCKQSSARAANTHDGQRRQLGRRSGQSIMGD
jgi:hypothetical protein